MNFKNIGEAQQINQHYAGSGRVTIFVESTDDQEILKKWFPKDQDRLKFQSVSHDDGSNGGCQAVKKALEAYQSDRHHSAPAFGILDRDVLLSDPLHREKLWWETDSTTFREQQPYGEALYILERWELENYLLKPAALQAWFKDKAKQPTPHRQLSAEGCLENEHDFTLISCIAPIVAENNHPHPSTTQNHEGESVNDNPTLKKEYGIGFAMQEQGDKLSKTLCCQLKTSQNTLVTCQKKISDFGQKKDDPAVKWDKLSRLLDGKRILARLSNQLKGKHISKKKLKGLDLNDDSIILAQYVATTQTIDSELHAMIKKFRAAI